MKYIKEIKYKFYIVLFIEVYEINLCGISLCFITVFLFLKSYTNCLISELSQLCYKGLIRSISLSSTDGLCTFIYFTLFIWQPIIVPVGKLPLGRVLNVLGSSIDSFINMYLSSMFCNSNLVNLIYYSFRI